MKFPIIFRFDASSQIGLGHAYRCLALIEHLALYRSICCLIVVRELPEYLKEKLIAFNTTVIELKTDSELCEIKKLSQFYASQLLVLDGYQFDQTYRLNLAKKGLKIVCFDDINSLSKLYCDLLINAVPTATQLEYQKTAPNAQHLLGLDYSIIREEFIRTPKIDFLSRKKLLINFGGSDTANLTLPLISLLASCPELVSGKNIVVVTGGVYEKVDQVADLCELNGFQHIHNCHNMATILSACRMAICAPGTIVYELAYCGVPSLFLTVADNQKLSAQAHQDIGWCKTLDGLQGNSCQTAMQYLHELWCDTQLLASMSSIALKVVDGLGVKRIIDKIEQEIS